MILRQKPNNLDLYYAVDEKTHLLWTSLGMHPKYLWQGKFYYRITKELDNLIVKGGDRD